MGKLHRSKRQVGGKPNGRRKRGHPRKDSGSRVEYVWKEVEYTHKELKNKVILVFSCAFGNL